MTKAPATAFGVLLCAFFSLAEARAQSTFIGTVKDTSGAVLPGVSVEASSPVLIEKSRTTLTDERGAYKIIDLRPGTYTVTFTFPGFVTQKLEGIELPTNFTSTINGEMKIGAVAETINVATESPVVDFENNSKAQLLPREVLDSVPTAHTIQSVGQLVLGVTLTAPDVGGSQAMQQTYFSSHGAGTAQTTVMMDGMIINGLQLDGAVQSYLNDAGSQEMVYQTGGGSADSATGGLKLNMSPKEGGNTFHGSFYGGYESSGLQSSNLSPFLASHGVKVVEKIGTYHDVDGTIGGPIKKDKLWFFVSGRLFTVDKPITNTFYVPAGRTYSDCVNSVISCQQGVDLQRINSVLVRLTWQVTPRNKVSAYIDRLFKTRDRAMNAGDDPTTSGVRWNSPLYMTNTIKWTSTVTSKLLIEGGYSSNIERYNNLYEPGVEKPYGTPEWYAGARHSDTILGTTSNASLAEYGSYPDRYNVQAAASYLSGQHNIKVGFQNSWGPYNQTLRANADLYQNYLNTAPSTVTLLATPARWQDRLNANLGIYAQDTWKFNRLSVTYGLRWEYLSEQVTGQPAQSGRFANIAAFKDIHMPIWRTFSPRTAFVYDLFGNNKTAVRFGFNRFENAGTTSFAALYDPANAVIITASAPWKDLNADNIAQGAPGCVYLQPGCEINFATVPKNFGVISLASPDPKVKRPYSYGYNFGVTHELFRGVAVTAEFFHGDARNLLSRNNILRPGTLSGSNVSNPNYRAVTVFSPINGKPITVYDPISAAVQQSVQNVDSTDPNLKASYNGFEFNFNARLPHGGRLFGGSSTDRSIANSCSAAATNPNILLFCDQSQSGIPWRTQFKLAGVYPLPFWGIQLSGSFQALPGYVLGSSALSQAGTGGPLLTTPNGAGTVYTVTQATTYTACPGDSASAGCVVGAPVIPGMTQSLLNIPLIAPGTELTPRLNQVDFSFGKRFVFERLRIDPKVDLFNAFNSSDYYSVRSLVYSTAPGATYMLPQNTLLGRIVRFGLVVNW
jgi:hypothetical protein